MLKSMCPKKAIDRIDKEADAIKPIATVSRPLKICFILVESFFFLEKNDKAQWR